MSIDHSDHTIEDHNRSFDGSRNRVRVICRFRPRNALDNNHHDLKIGIEDDAKVTIGKTHSFRFDHIFVPDTTQTEVYQYSIRQSVEDFFNGYNGAVLAYGQTGSGKSYTMMGPSIRDDDLRGIIPRISSDLFLTISKGLPDVEFTVRVSFMEIYMENVKDLLNHKNEQKLTIHEDKDGGVYVKGLSKAFVSSSKELLHLLSQGLKKRTNGTTNMNQESTRAHSIFTIDLSQRSLSTGVLKKSKFSLVDLAGSEKVDKTASFGQTLEEAKKINSSLSSLGNVINALTDGESHHIPYRDSKLTRILQESLGGNSRTALILTCSSALSNEQETLSTLRFGSRAKNIKNNAHVNTELGVFGLKVKIETLEKENERLHSVINKLTMERNEHEKNREISLLEESSLLSNKQLNHNATAEIQRRDDKIKELENTILEIKMESLKTSHQEELKLFHLENALRKLGDKLNDAEIVNKNLERHLLISEKIMEARNIKMIKLKEHLREQKMFILKESINFENKLDSIKEKMMSSPDMSTDIERSPLEYDFKKSPILLKSPSSPSSLAIHDTSSDSPKMGLNLRIVKPLRGGGIPDLE